MSKILVKNAATKYVQEHYPDMNLELGDVRYNFKFSRYRVMVKSLTSEDTTFAIYANGWGKNLRDDYEYEVANSFTTLRRLSAQLDVKAEEIIENKLDYDFDYVSIRFAGDEKGDEVLNALTLDMELDINNPPAPMEAYVNVFTNNISWDKIAEIAADMHSTLKEQNIPISKYSVRLIPMTNKRENGEAVSWVNSLALDSFPEEMMSENNLPQVMEKFENDYIKSRNGKKD